MNEQAINFAGAVADRQSFLDGGRTITIEGESQPSLGWRLTLTFRREQDGETVEEADILLTDPAGADLGATFVGGTVSEITDQDGNVGAMQFNLEFELERTGENDAESAVRLSVDGTIAGEGAGTGGSLEGEAGEAVLLTVRMQAEDGVAVLQNPPTAPIPTSEDTPTPDRTG